MLRIRTSRREDPIEAAPEAAVGSRATEDRELADAVGLALLVVLDKLEPADRIAFVLHDLCAMPFDAIAPIVGKSTAAVRQLASRARRRVQGAEAPEIDLATQRRVDTEVLGFVKKADFSNGPFRWLTVASPEDPEGTQLQLALNDNPAAKAYQAAMFEQKQPAAMFNTTDVQVDYDRMKARGAEFPTPPTDVTASKIAVVNDTCGNLLQLTQLMW